MYQSHEPLLEQGAERTKKKRHEKDQMTPSHNSPEASKPGKRDLPLFSPTLFKAKEFDPL